MKIAEEEVEREEGMMWNDDEMQNFRILKVSVDQLTKTDGMSAKTGQGLSWQLKTDFRIFRFISLAATNA